MNTRQIERAAYIAAHRLMTTDVSAPELACPGARRSAVIDNMARIIKNVYEASAAPPRKAVGEHRIPRVVSMNSVPKRVTAAGI